MIRVAVIGVGAMGRNHARVYSEMPGVELVGVADSDPQLAQSVGRRYGAPSYTDYCQMLDEQRPDAITIAVPTIRHREVALSAIEHGSSVLIEKPIAFSVEEGRAIIEAANRAGVQLMIGHIERFN